MSAPTLTAELLRSILIYEPETGKFTWRSRTDVRSAWNTRYAGREAGYVWRASKNVCYRCIRIFDWPFYGHRLAFLYMTGKWPEAIVDHEDLDGLNNRWGNLRQATKAQNAANSPTPLTNTTGFKGVSRCRGGRYRASIRIDGRQVWLGRFATPEAAHEAYCRAAVSRSGEYARLS